MASSEKQMIPLETKSIPQENDSIAEQHSANDLLDVKFPSRPRRKVVTIAGVIAVLIVVIVAASLIGKYVPDYLSDANSKCKWGKPIPRVLFPSRNKALGMRLAKWNYTLAHCNSERSKLNLYN